MSQGSIPFCIAGWGNSAVECSATSLFGNSLILTYLVSGWLPAQISTSLYLLLALLASVTFFCPLFKHGVRLLARVVVQGTFVGGQLPSTVVG